MMLSATIIKLMLAHLFVTCLVIGITLGAPAQRLYNQDETGMAPRARFHDPTGVQQFVMESAQYW